MRYKLFPMLMASTLLFIGGGWRVTAAGADDSFAAALVTAGMICLGAWIRDFQEPIKREEKSPAVGGREVDTTGRFGE